MRSGRPRRAGPINWARVHDRLARAADAYEGALELSPERARAVMDERARALARVSAERAALRAEDVVIFQAQGERYALETAHVREVVRLADLTPLPGAPDYVAGVTNLRGQILAVVDLGKLFGVAPARPGESSRVLVLGGGREEFGILADAVDTVAALAEGQIREPELPAAGIGRECLRGVTPEGVIVLDGAALLRDPRLLLDQEEGA